MSNYYELLGVSRGASASVVKIAYEGKLKALARSGLSEAERRAEEKELEKAFVTLSNPAKVSWYDKQLDSHAATESASHGRGAMIGAAAVVIILAGGVGWYFVERAHKLEALRVEGERLKTEQARLVLEREREERAKEIERARLEHQPAQTTTTTRRLEIRVSGDERDQALRERAYNDAQASRERREQQLQEDRNRRIAEEDRRRAQAEVDRQKRYLRERELEEERARIARSRR